VKPVKKLHRDVIRYWFSGYSPKEISQILGVNHNTVKTIIYRFRRKAADSGYPLEFLPPNAKAVEIALAIVRDISILSTVIIHESGEKDTVERAKKIRDRAERLVSLLRAFRQVVDPGVKVS